MKHTIFTFGDTWWLQTKGTAMGTPCACIYATLFFAYYERVYLLPKYGKNLLYYGRQIDDIFLIWNPSPTGHSFQSFLKDLDSQSNLNWTTDGLQDLVDFLDLTISIDSAGKIQTKTYQKLMLLFAYLPLHSTHPLGVLKSLIFGLV